MENPTDDELVEMAEELESGYFLPISGITDIAAAVALLLRREVARSKKGE